MHVKQRKESGSSVRGHAQNFRTAIKLARPKDILMVANECPLARDHLLLAAAQLPNLCLLFNMGFMAFSAHL
ncbi:unnamed protein product [Ilex paraguariensis]|uniref:Uncharacterized protein n=1 Tax=Ilex paraguariensis TaxID=185542 RepID=A0ABC8R903_9AQUA